ncbi:hypothetical protein [Flavobacterium sp. ENC]|uniref:hypothetical protein n=1 Tax=Flavobacterium sp. ENC TaxID=2897330 RepID=UPI001E657777|nr:hypothetical protein [Flavobacterium sp. ENC]MCD0467671.1 hypothetical protein [Flavobacterium sp. ENC]
MKKTIFFLTAILTTSLSFGQSVTGTGTLNRIPKFISSGVIGDSNIADSNTAVGVAAPSSIANTLTVNNTSYSSLDVNGTVSIGLGFANHIGAKIEGFKQTVNTTGLKLYTEVGFNNPSLAMTILANGNIGIGGQTSILNKFEVKVPTSTGLSGVDGIAVHDGAANRIALNLGINTVGEYSWIQSSKGGIGSKNLSINPNGGNVGIGTTSAPIAKLHVVDAAGGFFFDGSNAEYNRFKSTAVAPGTPKPLLISAQLSGTTPDIYVNTSGNVGLGTMNPTSMLTVAGNINSREVKVTVDAGADFVFENNYNLASLDAVDKYIKENKHLPEIASADKMKKEGINLSEMNIKLLQKIEELTLYAIDQEKKTEKLSNYISELNKLILEQNKRLEKLEK